MNAKSRLVTRIKSEAFWPWKIFAVGIEWVAGSRIARIAISRIRYNRWKMRLNSLGEGTVIYPNVVIHSPDRVDIGRNVSVVEFVHIWGGGGVTIADGVMIASHSVITSQTHDTSFNRRRDNICTPVCIGRNVWIGAGAIVLPGVSIGDNSVIGAGSVVARDVPKDVVVTGAPAQILVHLSDEPAGPARHGQCG